MNVVFAVAGVLLVLVTLADGFETMILPRRVSRRVRLTRYYYKSTWAAWSNAADHFPRGGRESFLSFYGPLSLLALFAFWALLLIAGFGLFYRGIGFTAVSAPGQAQVATTLYYSGTTFFTLGLGDVSSTWGVSRAVTVLEAGTGFGFLAMVIGYLPVLYQSFSRREVSISLLDARAGSPPTAGAFFARFPLATRQPQIDEQMATWERWCAELLESHLSYSLLAYFRSQHDRQSWLAALTAMLDASAILVALGRSPAGSPGQLLFAMSRHVAVDLAQIFSGGPPRDLPDRLPPGELERLHKMLGEAWPDGEDVPRRLNELRAGYEPLVYQLSVRLRMPLPPWLPAIEAMDDWQTGPGE